MKSVDQVSNSLIVVVMLALWLLGAMLIWDHRQYKGDEAAGGWAIRKRLQSHTVSAIWAAPHNVESSTRRENAAISQFESTLRYGTVHALFATGGPDDAITPSNSFVWQRNGRYLGKQGSADSKRESP